MLLVKGSLRVWRPYLSKSQSKISFNKSRRSFWATTSHPHPLGRSPVTSLVDDGSPALQGRVTLGPFRQPLLCFSRDVIKKFRRGPASLRESRDPGTHSPFLPFFIMPHQARPLTSQDAPRPSCPSPREACPLASSRRMCCRHRASSAPHT
jgi:hypothetical protein